MTNSVPRAQTLLLGHSSTNSRQMPAERASHRAAPGWPSVLLNLPPLASSKIPSTITTTPADRVRYISSSMVKNGQNPIDVEQG